MIVFPSVICSGLLHSVPNTQNSILIIIMLLPVSLLLTGEINHVLDAVFSDNHWENTCKILMTVTFVCDIIFFLI